MKKLAVILILGLISFLPADVPLSTAFTQLNAFSGNPSGNIVVGTVNNVARKFNAADFLNRTYHTGLQDITTINGLQTALNGKQSTINLTTTGSGVATFNGTTLNVPTVSGGGVDTNQNKPALKQFIQDNAPTVDYAVDGDYSFDRIGGKLYAKGMKYFPSFATSYGTIIPDPYCSNASGAFTFRSNGSAIPNGSIICTVTFTTTTYSVAPFPQVGILQNNAAGQFIYPQNRSVNGFQIAIQTGFTPANNAEYYYSYQVGAASNTSAP